VERLRNWEEEDESGNMANKQNDLVCRFLCRMQYFQC